MEKPFHIYRSSAGSGKTRTLAKAYLKLALASRTDYFKHILAVTFTNKATQEMKERI
ncbi:MAG TPA: UvrD-helicase domain-containing protein, partial [Bacteroidales bacterium]|nr:UvrD-helicase domain-containing protein [Bacteroidales bacterium]